MQVLQNNIYDKLQYIKKNFVDPANKSIYLGDGLEASGTLFGGASFIDKLFSGYTDFKAAYGASVNTAATAGPIYIRNLDAENNTYQAVQLAAAAANLSTYHAGATELNLSAFLVPGSALATQMDKLMNTYSLLESATYDKYKLGQSFKLQNYTVASGTKTAVGPSKTRDAATMQLIVDLTGITTPVDLLPLANLAGRTGTGLNSGAITSAGANGPNYITLTPSASLPSGSVTASVSRSPVQTGVMTVTFKIRGNSQLQLASGPSLSPIYTPNPVNWTVVSWQAPVSPPASAAVGVAPPAPTIEFKSWYNGIASNTVDIADLRVIYDSEIDTLGTIPMLGPKTDIFVVRRLLGLYMAIVNCYVAMGYYDATGGSATGAFNLVNLCYENIQQLNKNLLSPEMSGVRDSLNANMTAFNANATAINDLDAAVSEMKMDLRTKMSLYDTTKNQNSKTQIYMYITLAIFLLIVVSAGGIAFTSYDPTLKVVVTGVLWLVAMVVGWIIYRAYRKNVQEHFAGVPAGAAVFEIQNYNTALNASNILSNIAAFNVAIFEEVDKYLDNTININVTLRTARDYGNMNNAIGNEITAFKGRQYQISRNINQVADSRNILQLANKDNTAKITLFISLMVILAGTVFALMALENYPTAHVLVYIVATVAVFLAAALYILDVTGRVRTMGTNMYWAQPDVTNM